jgi:hypothetical protein
MKMTYADARYELLNMIIGEHVEIADCYAFRWFITRTSADSWEFSMFGKLITSLADVLLSLGYVKEPSCGPGAMVAEYQEETGCDWESALVACNCD